MDLVWLWIPATLVAAAAQAGRNAVQRGLTASLGTLGATQVRFLFGFPFALLYLLIVCLLAGQTPPGVNTLFLLFVLGGAVAQIAATALMLAAMRDRSFVVVTAWTKTEPIQVALFGFAVLGDPLSPVGMLAVVLATLGVVLMSAKPAGGVRAASWRPAWLGLLSGAGFALSAVCFRGAILKLDGGMFAVQATWTLCWSLGVQVLILMTWMLLCNRPLLRACAAAWRASIWGGFLGATASQAWFIGFALTAAANVRTLGLVEVLFAQALSQKLFAHAPSRRETAGIALIVGGVVLLLLAAGQM
ncbi:DMT superfamily permease [Bordetella ansorpii]|uniref:DMT superfamily permease n=1 Tax=Bordetella ansorpii TaxID=288768 RepID=A0A157SSK6_9BORD|nr:DMT family transporter [Bordetella ansorpii]SAI73291.1 DMT superfamily permease [Bordetella ansorpii]